MAVTPAECLEKLRQLYADAFKVYNATNQQILDWADKPETWATHKIAYGGWTYFATEAVVRSCRIYRKRAHVAAAVKLKSAQENR
tara:strand:- start:146 stop:400 length:255 start_codon:yes stop_codon:yes gene_type:complete